MLIKLDDAMRVVRRFAKTSDVEALRKIPVATVDDDMVERAMRAWIESAANRNLLHVSMRAALEAALGPLPAPPSEKE